MSYKTVNLRPDTYERLREYKVAGLSFDEVVQRLLDQVDREVFYEVVLDEHDSRGNEMKDGGYATLRELQDALDE